MAYTNNYYENHPLSSSNPHLQEDKKLLSTNSKKSRYGSFTLPSDTSRKIEEYVCKSGDTLAGVALKFDTSIENLKKLNKQLYYASSNLLRVGEVLVVSVKKTKQEINLEDHLQVQEQEHSQQVNRTSSFSNEDSMSTSISKIKTISLTDDNETNRRTSSIPVNKNISKPSISTNPSSNSSKNSSSSNITDFLSSFDKSLSSLKANVNKIEESSVLKEKESMGSGCSEQFVIDDGHF